jgi:hypothetical protein
MANKIGRQKHRDGDSREPVILRLTGETINKLEEMTEFYGYGNKKSEYITDLIDSDYERYRKVAAVEAQNNDQH